VRVTSPSRSSPREYKVSMRWEMPLMVRRISLNRIGPSLAAPDSTVHLSPMRARVSPHPPRGIVGSCLSLVSKKSLRSVSGVIILALVTKVTSFSSASPQLREFHPPPTAVDHRNARTSGDHPHGQRGSPAVFNLASGGNDAAVTGTFPALY